MKKHTFERTDQSWQILTPMTYLQEASKLKFVYIEQTERHARDCFQDHHGYSRTYYDGFAIFAPSKVF